VTKHLIRKNHTFLQFWHKHQNANAPPRDYCREQSCESTHKKAPSEKGAIRC